MASGSDYESETYNLSYAKDEAEFFRIEDESNFISIQINLSDLKLDAIDEPEIYVKSGFAPCSYDNKKIIIVSHDSTIDVETLKNDYPDHIFHYVNNKFFINLVVSTYQNKSLFLAEYLQIFKNPISNAFKYCNLASRLFIPSIISTFIFLIICTGYLGLVANLFYLLQTTFKFFIFTFAIKKEEYCELSEYNLPVYTILIPLYKEASKVSKLIENIEALDYPKSKLDVKFILEKDDLQTIRAVQILELPSYFHLIIVPDSLPKTKPKACNYAMQYAKGDYAVIYDAEDEPERDQLIKAVSNFRKLGDEYVCLQAKLKIKDERKNILGSLFQLEYDFWFSCIIKGLSKLGLPIMLGGTSNHFKVEYLKRTGYWDSYNVTEDAELGIRISLEGQKVSVLDSYTYEDPPLTLLSWFKQRTRWIKGYIITFFSYLKQDKLNLSFFENLSITIFLGTSIFSLFLTPIVIIEGIIYPTFYDWLKLLYCTNLVLFLILVWSTAIYLVKKDDKKLDILAVFYFSIFPIYFLLHTIAAYFALLEFILKPFKWNKTDHSV